MKVQEVHDKKKEIEDMESEKKKLEHQRKENCSRYSTSRSDR